jgi:hypothetical protein
MANQVYANNMEVSCKAANGKSVAAFPDVCFTPPQTPATPPGVPIPYPNTGLASDTTNGSRSVKISKKEVMLKNKSYFRKSYGDEAGCAPKKGIITSRNMGKVYFNAWSMNVRIEGENAVRMMDITTHNHGSFPGNSPTWPYIDEIAFGLNSTHPCSQTAKTLENKCGDLIVKTPRGRKASIDNICKSESSDCKNAMQCALTPFSPSNCCSDKTAHHLVEVHCFTKIGERGIADSVMAEFSGYSDRKAPCICASGPRDDKEHGAFHAVQQTMEVFHNRKRNATHIKLSNGESNWTYAEAREAGVLAQKIVFPDCDENCTRAQLDKYHQASPPDGPGVQDSTPVRSDLQAHQRSKGQLTPEQQARLNTSSKTGLAR